MDYEFDTQTELCREQVQRASPQYTFPDSGKKDDAVCHVCLKFQGYRAAIDKRILASSLEPSYSILSPQFTVS